jgi:hypothetical protein
MHAMLDHRLHLQLWCGLGTKKRFLFYYSVLMLLLPQSRKSSSLEVCAIQVNGCKLFFLTHMTFMIHFNSTLKKLKLIVSILDFVCVIIALMSEDGLSVHIGILSVNTAKHAFTACFM